jgi:hypothetical protein
MPPVWALSVDLQTKSATFTSGLADAAKGARASFQEIRESAAEMGTETGYSMTEARHSVMLLGEEFGVHLPRALSTFIASLGPIGGALEAAFPFLAIVVGATLLLEHLSKLSAEGQKLTESQVNFGTTVSNVLNGLNDKLLEAGIRADELRGDHLAALNKQLELIDHASMKELVQSFDVVAKSADATFAGLKTSWYQWGVGAAGAKASLESFKTQYDSLLAQGKDKDAAALLDAKIEREQRILDLQKQQNANQVVTGSQGSHGDYGKAEAAAIALKKMGVGYTEKEAEAQEASLGALHAQASAQEDINKLKAVQSGNAKTEEANKEVADQNRIAEAQQRGLAEYVRRREEAESKLSSVRRKAAQEEEELGMSKLHADDAFMKALKEEASERAKLAQEAGKEDAGHDSKMAELQLAADRQDGQLRISQGRMTGQAIVDMEIAFADREYAAQKQALDKEQTTLDTHAKDYENKLKALNDRQLELTRQHENQITQIKVKAEEERNSRILSAERKADDEIARGLTQVLMRHETFAKMMVSLGNQVVGGLMETALKSILADDMTKEHDAAAAARKAYLAGQQIGGPFGTVVGAAMAAVAFTSVMAFDQGGIVPGVGVGDTVPAILTPGEAVLPKKLTESLSNMAKFGDGNGDSAPDIHVHHHATYNVQAFDSRGVDQVLQDHGQKFTDHAVRTLRKMNR